MSEPNEIVNELVERGVPALIPGLTNVDSVPASSLPPDAEYEPPEHLRRIYETLAIYESRCFFCTLPDRGLPYARYVWGLVRAMAIAGYQPAAIIKRIEAGGYMEDWPEDVKRRVKTPMYVHRHINRHIPIQALQARAFAEYRAQKAGKPLGDVETLFDAAATLDRLAQSAAERVMYDSIPIKSVQDVVAILKLQADIEDRSRSDYSLAYYYVRFQALWDTLRRHLSREQYEAIVTELKEREARGEFGPTLEELAAKSHDVEDAELVEEENDDDLSAV